MIRWCWRVCKLYGVFFFSIHVSILGCNNRRTIASQINFTFSCFQHQFFIIHYSSRNLAFAMRELACGAHCALRTSIQFPFYLLNLKAVVLCCVAFFYVLRVVVHHCGTLENFKVEIESGWLARTMFNTIFGWPMNACSQT